MPEKDLKQPEVEALDHKKKDGNEKLPKESQDNDDLDNFKRLFAEADDKELMFWHVQKAFKAVLKDKKLKFIEFIIEDLDLPLGNHEAF